MSCFEEAKCVDFEGIEKLCFHGFEIVVTVKESAKRFELYQGEQVQVELSLELRYVAHESGIVDQDIETTTSEFCGSFGSRLDMLATIKSSTDISYLHGSKIADVTLNDSDIGEPSFLDLIIESSLVSG